MSAIRLAALSIALLAGRTAHPPVSEESEEAELKPGLWILRGQAVWLELYRLKVYCTLCQPEDGRGSWELVYRDSGEILACHTDDSRADPQCTLYRYQEVTP